MALTRALMHSKLGLATALAHEKTISTLHFSEIKTRFHVTEKLLNLCKPDDW